ncbi:unannotated protein [freshwater metagenome]|uniref:Unannotated protein n=1 Tax=freshwater metagenome TaxID=449393 RepID=A0A6J7SCG6_9ZZZZ|nr:hypothetical protein [Actinomycetota bacterium]
MAHNPIGPLGAADEGFTHQVADTFAVVGTSDPAWTEKVCAMAMARDGSLQIGFGLGRYPNRNVLDAYAAVSQGTQQTTVRGSRSLSSDPESTSVGPIRYQVLEPLQQVRFSLEANEVQPISFEITFDGIVPPRLEERTHLRDQYRVSADLVRYHQTGVATGWVQLDGQRTEVNPDSWVCTRDHSWGVRYDVGPPTVDRADSTAFPAGVGFMMIWCPALMERPDGSRYALHLHFTLIQMPGFAQKTVTAGVEHVDGSVDPIVDLQPDLQFDPQNRRLLGGTVMGTMQDGSQRPIQIEVLGDTGVQLGAGLYFGLDGHHHGEWRGEFHLDGERFEDCSDPQTARRLHQIRDTAVRVIDPVGGGVGWGNCQPIAAGPWPELGLADDPWM